MEPLDPDASVRYLHDLFRGALNAEHVLVGSGADDCAVLDLNGTIVVVTTDFINASPMSIELGIGDLADLGWYAVAANLSDLCGTGADPMALLVGVTFPHGSMQSELVEFSMGVRNASEQFRVPVVGGDTKLGGARAIFGVAIGTAASAEALYLQSSAKLDDDIWVSGDLGSSAAAVTGLSLGFASRSWSSWAKDAVLRPSLPLEKAHAIAGAQIANGGIDLSDGLAADLHTLGMASGVGIEIDAAMLPISDHVRPIARLLNVTEYSIAVVMGGDLQFAVTAAQCHAPILQSAGLTRIGKTVSGRGLTMILPDEGRVEVPPLGHRDARKLSFADEIRTLATRIDSLVRMR